MYGILQREKSSDLGTPGFLAIAYSKDSDSIFRCSTLEPARNSKLFLPIKAGIYKCSVCWSPINLCYAILLEGVEGHSAIEIHPGTRVIDTKGCILVGVSRNLYTLDLSKDTFNLLMQIVYHDSRQFTIEIKD